MRVIYWSYEKDGFTIGGYAKSIDDAAQLAKEKIGGHNHFWKRDYNYQAQLLKFDNSAKAFVQMLDIAHSAGRMSERRSMKAAYAKQ